MSEGYNNEKPILLELKRTEKSGPYSSRFFDYQIANRYLFRLQDGRTIESGAYQHFSGAKRKPVALAIDISTMVGCPMQCKFCASSFLTYIRPLTVEEMVAQVKRLISEKDNGFEKIVCSFQGIGETSLIPDVIMQASRRVLQLDPRCHISIATLGNRLEAFRIWCESEVPIDNLQVSCSGTTNEQIDWLMPGIDDIETLFSEVKQCTYAKNINKIKINYVLIRGFNDSQADLTRLITKFGGTSIIIKISALNQTFASQHNRLVSVSQEQAQRFSAALIANGVDSFLHGSFKETNISCGQLTFIE